MYYFFLETEYSSRNATKCREHLAFKCQKIEEEVRDNMRATFSQEYINSFAIQKRSTIWEHYNIIEDEGITYSECFICLIYFLFK